MNVQPMAVSRQQACDALLQYKEHRSAYDKKDWEIERIYRAISKGKVVVDALAAIRRAGVDAQGRPLLAICQAHALKCQCDFGTSIGAMFGIAPDSGWRMNQGRLVVAWPELQWRRNCVATLPRIPPQHRPAAGTLSNYHILWEADWADVPRDPMLLRRIGKDAWVVLAAWDLTDVELSVARSYNHA